MTRDALEPICMEMIAYAGEGKVKVFEALECYKRDDKDGARAKLAEAEEFVIKAHEVQFRQLMGPQSEGEEIPFDMLLLHGMDLVAGAASMLEVFNCLLADPK
ncbi:PTS lactose/cellobiose transporter subunit IIA [Caproiciproducens sp.]